MESSLIKKIKEEFNDILDFKENWKYDKFFKKI